MGNLLNLFNTYHKNLKNIEERIPSYLNSNDFLKEFNKEKMRADRTLLPFTLLLFNIKDKNDDKHNRLDGFEALAKIIQNCARGSDSKGWYYHNNDLRIGLILNDTPIDKSQRLINTIKEKFHDEYLDHKKLNKNQVDIHCEIWMYPNRSEDTIEKSIPIFKQRNNEQTITITKEQPLSSPLPLWKRTMDVSGALFGIILLSPLFALTAILIKIVSPGPVFFLQKRVGYLGKIFTLYKFRTMHVNNDTSQHQQYLAQLIKSGAEDGNEQKEIPMIKMENNPQIIPFGKLIRKSCIDELPQLFNVLLGEMSLIGPRPSIPYEVDEFIHWYHGRFDTVPGMTGLWQVNGKNKLSFRKMIRLDILYARNRSPLLDLKILFKTLPAIIEQARESLNKEKGEIVNNAEEII